MSAKALGKHYFPSAACPVAVRRVQTRLALGAAHAHDLTGVEHDHDFDELVMVVAGRATHHLEGAGYPVAAGDVYLLQKHNRHYFTEPDGLELVNVMFDPGRVSLPQEELRAIPGFNALFLLEPAYRRQHRFQSRLFLPPIALQQAIRLTQEIADEVTAGQPGFAIAAKTKLLELMIHLARQYDQTTTSREGQSLLRLGQLMGMLERHYDKPWTLAEMAGETYLSPSHLVREFRRATGQTPMSYLIQLRLRHATRLLDETTLPVTQIALRTGFGDSNYLARQFRRRLGTTPTAHRRSFAGRRG